MNIRELRQKEHGDHWINGSQKAIALLCVRFGKIKTSINIMHELLDEKSTILIAYPDKIIKDSWVNDFKKWGFKYEKNVIFTTYASLGKHIKSWDFVILDEIHEASSDKRMEAVKGLFKLNNRILGLTGTLKKWSRIPLENIGFEISSEYSIEDGIKDGILPQYEIHVHCVPLNNQKIIGKTSKGKPQTEQGKFNAYTWIIEKEMKEKKPDQNKIAMLRLARMRILMESPSKKEKVKEFLKENLDKRLLIFTGTTKTADELGDSHHSKNADENNLQRFIDGDINHVTLCKIGDTGVTYPMLDGAVLVYTNSNPEDFEQKIGRTLIFDYQDKVARITIISSKQQAELDWLEKAMYNIPPQRIKYHGINR